MNLNDLWFVLLGVLLAGYAVLDGFDLGVGVLHLFSRGDRERRVMLNAIGPLWDGNEVWLVTFGGALFAAFPRAYATLLSGLYLPFMLLLSCIIGRAISIEFRSKHPSPLWRGYWDASFALSSTLALFVMGAAVGLAMRGLPIESDGEMRGGLHLLADPYAFSVGALAVAAGALHGANYLSLKVESELLARVLRWRWPAFGVFLVLYLLVTIETLVWFPHAAGNFSRTPFTWVVPLALVIAVANLPRAFVKNLYGQALVSSAVAIASLVALFGVALFPRLARSSIDDAFSLTVVNAASSQGTLRIMRNIAFLGLPFVAAYSALVYWVFRGRVKIDTTSY